MSEVIVRSTGEGVLKQDVTLGRHYLVSDEPFDVGGSDAGPSPYDLLLAALGSCTAMTLVLYARRKGWPLEGVTVRLRHSRIHADDCSDCETREGFLDYIDRGILLEGPLDPAQRARLVEIATRCPVHRTLTSEIKIDTHELPTIARRADAA